MGTITITTQISSPALTVPVSVTIADAQLVRLYKAMQAYHGQVIDTTVVPQTNPPTLRNMTPTEAIAAMCRTVVDGWIGTVLQVEQQTATAAALAAVTPITAQ